MSFEYYGAFKAIGFLRDNGASKDQAEAVGEAIIRHADLGETGMLTSLGMLIQLSTVFGMLCYFSSLLVIAHLSVPFESQGDSASTYVLGQHMTS